MRWRPFIGVFLAMANAAADATVPSQPAVPPSGEPVKAARSRAEWRRRCAAELSAALADLAQRDPGFLAVEVTTGAEPYYTAWVVALSAGYQSRTTHLRLFARTQMECPRCGGPDAWRNEFTRLDARSVGFDGRRTPAAIEGSITGDNASVEVVREMLARLERAVDRCDAMRPRRR